MREAIAFPEPRAAAAEHPADRCVALRNEPGTDRRRRVTAELRGPSGRLGADSRVRRNDTSVHGA